MASYGAIQEAVNQRAGMGEILAAVRGAYANMPGPTPPINPADVAQLRSFAAAQRNASENLAAAPGEWGLSSDMISQTPWARDLATQAAAPEWQVRFQQTVADELGQVTTNWRSVILTGTLPATVQALYDEVEASAEAMANEYGVTHRGISSLQILAR